MPPQIVLGLGTGQCGFQMLREILGNQASARITLEQTPVLPWKKRHGLPGIRERIVRWRETCTEKIVGDVASFYLPYVLDAIEFDPLVRLIYLKRPREEIIANFCRHLDATLSLPTNHWSEIPSDGWYHDPVWTQTFPQYHTSDREEAIGLYCDEYAKRMEDLSRQFPDQIMTFDPQDLCDARGVRRLLDFVGIPAADQKLLVGRFQTASDSDPKIESTRHRDSLDAGRCVILVPTQGMIHPDCDVALRELERRGYTVRRVGGYAAIDQGRNQMATDALIDGFEETMWIDSDIGFDPDDVGRLRGHNLPIVSGIYPQKGTRVLASHTLPGTPELVFGERGGLTEMLYAATGFLLVRREVYSRIQQHLSLPTCNERFQRPMIPYFLPMIRPMDDGHWYLAEDYSFCERVRQAGFKIYADTRIRLWHIGWYRFGWEDSGGALNRFGTYTLNLDIERRSLAPSLIRDPRIDGFADEYPWPASRPQVPLPPERNWLFDGTRQALTQTVAANTNLIVEVGSWLGRSTRFLCDLAPSAAVIAIDTWNGSPEHFHDPELTPLLPHLYETFLSESWEYRHRIIPLRADSLKGLKIVAEAGLAPDVIYLDADHSYESVVSDLNAALEYFPTAKIVGDDWDWEGVRRAVEETAVKRQLRVELFQNAWRIIR